MPTAIVLSYDNGLEYEDHRQCPVAIAPNQAEADRLVALFAQWAAQRHRMIVEVEQARAAAVEAAEDAAPSDGHARAAVVNAFYGFDADGRIARWFDANPPPVSIAPYGLAADIRHDNPRLTTQEVPVL